MTTRWFDHMTTIVFASALVACSQSTSAPTASTASKSAALASQWTDHGATACDAYLTPAVVGEILAKPDGHAKKLSAQSCAYETNDFANISITLTAGGVRGLDAHMPYLVDTSPLAGVGDKAVRTATGIEAAKGADRTCSVDVTPPFAAKEKGDALAQKLGAICNTLLALP